MDRYLVIYKEYPTYNPYAKITCFTKEYVYETSKFNIIELYKKLIDNNLNDSPYEITEIINIIKLL